jgi:hypothetical protein
VLAATAATLPGPGGRAMADFATMTPTEMAEQSALIVVGLFLGAQRVRPARGAAAQPDDLHLGVLQVGAVLKGDPDMTVALLRLPPPRPGGMRASAEVALSPGQHGLWYLRQDPDGLYELDRPDRFVPMDQAEGQIRALRDR